MNNEYYSRRKFLGVCGKMSSLPVLSTICQLKMTNSVLAQSVYNDYKATVCVFLAGGNDSYNMLVPNERTEYSRYSESRGSMAIAQNSLHDILDRNNGNKKYGIHPSMPEIANLYEKDRDLGFVANIGSMFRPLDKSDFERGLHVPRGLFSHFEQEAAWQTSIADRLASQGWMGRIQDLITDASNSNPAVSINISPTGASRYQTGAKSSPYVIGDSLDDYSGIQKDAINETLEQRYGNLLANHHAYNRQSIIEQSEAYEQALSGASLKTVFPNSGLGNELKKVALAISRRNQLGHSRQTFFVRMRGWDTHAGLLSAHNLNLPEVSQALKAFNDSMKELGVHDNVLTYTASDFGRSLTPNGDGTDHGWGGNQLIMGGMVKGGRIFGKYPTDLRLGAATDVGRGRQLPTTSCDQFHAEIAEWYGIRNRADMETVLPNIRNFWSRNQAPVLNMFA